MIELEVSYGRLDEKILEAIEELWCISQLPKDYRQFLLKNNGGIPLKKTFFFKDGSDAIGIDKFFGIIKDSNSIHSNLLLKQKDAGDRFPENMLPIGRENFGNLILLSVKGPDRGKVYFWDHEMEAGEGEEPTYDNLTLIADSFDEFISSLKDYDI